VEGPAAAVQPGPECLLLLPAAAAAATPAALPPAKGYCFSMTFKRAVRVLACDSQTNEHGHQCLLCLRGCRASDKVYSRQSCLHGKHEITQQCAFVALHT
jgi:hypothetical protein